MTYYGAKELAESFRTVRKNTIQIAEDIPEDKYGFKAADDVRTVEKLLTHLVLTARSQYQIHKEKRSTFEGVDFPALFQQPLDSKARVVPPAELPLVLRWPRCHLGGPRAQAWHHRAALAA